jgi:hypothetical protein
MSDPGSHHTLKAVGVELGLVWLVIAVFLGSDVAKWLRAGDCTNPVAVWEVIIIAAVSANMLCNLFKLLLRMLLLLVVLSIVMFVVCPLLINCEVINW